MRKLLTLKENYYKEEYLPESDIKQSEKRRLVEGAYIEISEKE